MNGRFSRMSLSASEIEVIVSESQQHWVDEQATVGVGWLRREQQR